MANECSEAIMKETAALLANLFQDDIPSFFMPYLVLLIDDKQYAEINIETITKDFTAMFGIELDDMMIDRLCNEALAREYIFEMQGRYCSNPLKTKSHQFDKSAKAALSRFQDLKDAYSKFVVEEKGLPAIIDPALDEVVFKLIQNVSINLKDDTSDTESEDHPSDAASMSAHEMALNDFMLYADKEHPEIVDVVNQFAVSDSLWSVIANSHTSEPYFKEGTKIFLDTKCIFRLIGLEGTYWKRVYQNFVETLKSCGAEVIVFDHVLEEINRVIKSARRSYKEPDFDISRASAIACHFRNEGYSDSTIDKILYNLNENPSLTYGFSIEPHEYEQLADQFQIDYNEFLNILIETYRESNPTFDPEEKDQTIETDAKSITMTYRLRGDSIPRKISDADFIFVTTNTSLAQAASRYEKIHRKNHNSGIPVCYSANYLSTIIWLALPTNYIKISKQMLLAYCYAAANPTKEQISAYFQAIDQLKKDKDYSADQLQYLKESRTLLRQYTLTTAMTPTGRKPSLEESLERFKQQASSKISSLEESVSKQQEQITNAQEKIDQFQKDADSYATSVLEWTERKTLPFLPAAITFLVALVSTLFVSSQLWKNVLTIGGALCGLFLVIFAIWVRGASGHEKLHNWLRDRYAKKHLSEMPGWRKEQR